MVHRAKTDQHDLFYGPSYPVQLTDYKISLLFCPYTCNQPTTYNITSHVTCLAVRRRLFKESLTRDFRDQIFFHKSVSPGPLSIPLGPFRIFSKIRGDIRK